MRFRQVRKVRRTRRKQLPLPTRRHLGRLRRSKLNKTTAVGVGIVAVLVVVVMSMTFQQTRFPRRRINTHPEVVAAFQIPQRNILVLRELSNTHAMDFAEVLAVYSLENDFFPNRQDAPPAETIEHMFIRYYEYIYASLRRIDIERYEEIFRNLLAELRFFPIPLGFDTDPDPSYMFGDSWGTATPGMANTRFPGGTNIYDRENVPGRIPIIAIASGTVIRAGRTPELGYSIEILGERGTTITYAHLHSIDGNISAGQPVVAGEALGTMGNTGGLGAQLPQGNTPVRLRITIAPETNIARDFHINPYPFLSLLLPQRIPAPPLPGQLPAMPQTAPWGFPNSAVDFIPRPN